MHIPDGYLSPATCVSFGLVMVPAWMAAARKVRNWLKSRYVPLMAIGAAFSFTIMMYNVPIPGGTSAHAVGGGLLAIVLGPWAAMICITIALAIQALLFGDGGIWTFTANCFNMALVLPFISYGVYRLCSGRNELHAKRRWVGAAVGGYLGINAAALAAGVELGLQPILFHSAQGLPLYCPYPLSVAVPAMLFAHFAFAGPLEAVVTALVVRYLQSCQPDLLNIKALSAAHAAAAAPISYRRLWWGLGSLLALSPLGLLASGTAWGEWGAAELQKILGFIPAGMQRLADTWSHAPFGDYALPGFESFWSSALVYLLCAVIGAGSISLLTYLFWRFQLAESRGQN
ncbi:MAG: cobalt transporter CbiM [Desulfobaccales bacterium]